MATHNQYSPGKMHRNPMAKNKQYGLSLLELLVVVSILAAIAGIGTAYYDSIGEDKKDDLTRIEINQLAAAVKQFHTDTGTWPGFADVDLDGDTDEHSQPFSWSILTDTNLASWDAVSNRGWRGPYINRMPVDSVNVPNGSEIDLNGLDNDASKAPVDISVNNTLTDAWGNAYALLAIKNRNIIISAGKNGVFESLSDAVGDDCSGTPPDPSHLDACESELYVKYCSDIQGDDIAVCP